MRRNLLKLGCLLAFGCFLSLTWFTLSLVLNGREAHFDLQPMYKRLLAAEAQGDALCRDLNRLLGQPRNFSGAANTSPACGSMGLLQPSGSMGLLQPTVCLYLPHLRLHPDSLTPIVHLGQGRKGVSLVLGIPTVKRENAAHLVGTLSSLLYNLSPSQRLDLLIIVFVAETDSEYVRRVAEIIEKGFHKEVLSGLLEVVSPSQFFYPNLTGLKEPFGDSQDRVKRRTKMNLDYSFLMLYAQDKGTYYVMLEDDIEAKADYYSAMKTYVTQMSSDQWLFLDFSQLGSMGKLFRTRDLPMITNFFLMFHKDKPVDWLLDYFLWLKVCNPEKPKKDCDEEKLLLKPRYKPSLFQHVGLHSSLPGKLQRLEDYDF